MKYRIIHISVNGSHDYSLRIEERISVWSRFLFSVKPKVFTIRGDGHGYWEQHTYSAQLPHDLIEFANEVVYQYEHSIRLRQQSSWTPR